MKIKLTDFEQGAGYLVAAFLFILFTPLLVISQVTSTFDTVDSLEGWRAVGDGIFYFESGTGHPGSCMRVDDDATGSLLIAIAPAKFLGNWSAATAADSLSADIFLHFINGSPFIPGWVFRISGPGGTAKAFQGASTPPYDVWTHFAISLDSSQWNMQQGNWQALMQHVSMLEILVEYITGDEYVRLDNPTLSFIPTIATVMPPLYSEFDQGSWEGWTFVNTGGVSIQASGGNPQGYVRINDQGGVLSHGIASSAYLGNWSGLTNNAAIQLDLNIISHSGNFSTMNDLIRLSGPGGVATVPVDSSILAAEEGWKSFSYMLNPSVWTVESGNWLAILANITDVSIFPEFYSSTETIGFDNFRLSNDPPDCQFTANTNFIFPEDTVQFYDRSRFVPESWQWSFGDGMMSNQKDPAHPYSNPGMYDVELIATNQFGSDSLLLENYIEVASISDSILYFDNFNNDTIHQAWQFRNGTWVENSGIMRQTSNYFGTGYINGAFAIVGSKFWSDYTLSVDIHSTDDDKIGFVFRYQDPQNFYLFAWQQQGSLRFIKRFVDGVEMDLAVDSVAYTSHTWYHVDLVTDDSLFKCVIDSVLIFEVIDTTFASGKAGLYCHGNQSSYWDNFSITQTNFIPTSIDPHREYLISDFTLYQNYPNPFNPSTKISWRIEVNSPVRLTIFNLVGQRVATLIDEKQQAGYHFIEFSGSGLASGIYFYQLQAGEYVEMRKMVLMK